MIEDHQILNECYFKTSRSSGSGGQHVNKVETKVTLYFDINNSKMLSQNQKEILLLKLKKRIDKYGIMTIKCQEFKSQFKNKKRTEILLLKLLKQSLKKNKKRIPVKISNTSIEKRLKSKKRRSDIKKNRNKNFLNYK